MEFTFTEKPYSDEEYSVTSISVQTSGEWEEVWKDVMRKWKTVQKYLETKNADELVQFDMGGTETCAFCKEYYNQRCQNCPIFRFTKTRFCAKTPNEEFERNADIRVSYAVDIVNREIDFLNNVYAFEHEQETVSRPKYPKVDMSAGWDKFHV